MKKHMTKQPSNPGRATASFIARLAGGTVLTLAGLAGVANPAMAADWIWDVPAGVACTFQLRVENTGTNTVYKEFMDKQGNVVRTLSAGQGAQVTFKNPETGAALSLRPSGAVLHTTLNSDGTSTGFATGHTVLILFPTDYPAGPSTTLYVGRFSYTVDLKNVWTLDQKTSGKKVDICAALSS